MCYNHKMTASQNKKRNLFKKICALAALFAALLIPLSVRANSLIELSSQNALLIQMKQELAQTEYRYFLLENNVEVAEEGLLQLEEQTEYLVTEIARLESEITDQDDQILSVKRQREEKKIEVSDLEAEAILMELELEDKKEAMSELMMLLYVKRQRYFEGEELRMISMLLSEDSVSESLAELTHIEIMEDYLKESMAELANGEVELAEKWATLHKKQAELAELDKELGSKQLASLDSLEAQKAMLDELRVEKQIFEAMLGSSNDRREDLIAKMSTLKQSVQQVQRQIMAARDALSEEEKIAAVRVEEELTQELEIELTSEELIADFVDLDWPVPVQPGITAYFQDSGYVRAFGVQHYAVDIRAAHGTPIYAPADGMVYDVVFDPTSTRYAYIMLVHSKGLMTVYGHVSGVEVAVGDFVHRGELVGFTGATPGGIGAGLRTTGPHLHLETFLDGVKVDPLLYFPIEEISEEDLPFEYLDVYEARVRRTLRELQGQENVDFEASIE